MMRHLSLVSKPLPVPAYYFNVSLTQKLSELVTIGSILETAKSFLTGGS
jgi:hypothetical protein